MTHFVNHHAIALFLLTAPSLANSLADKRVVSTLCTWNISNKLASELA